jgi:hypothetical protein
MLGVLCNHFPVSTLADAADGGRWAASFVCLVWQVETSQSQIRIVGLSATLPNYQDVAVFLRCHPENGLFYFDNSYRPIPLSQMYIGVSEPNIQKRANLMNQICFDKIVERLKHGHQVQCRARLLTVRARPTPARFRRAGDGLRACAERDRKDRQSDGRPDVQGELFGRPNRLWWFV